MREKINEILREAVEELNEQMDADKKIEFSEELRLVGSNAALDSISFVTLIAITEDLIREKLGKNIMIVNDKAFSQERSPFRSISALTDYINGLISEAA